MMDHLIGFKEVAEMTRIPESSIRKMVTKKRIPCVRIGKHVLVRDNKEWTEEYENVLAVLRGLAGL